MIPKDEQARTNIVNPMFDFPYNINQKVGGFIEIQASLKSRGNLNILLHGWVWGESNSPLPDIYSPNQRKEGRLDANASSFKFPLGPFLLNKKYIIRPFVSTGKDTIYGNPLEFQIEVAELSGLMQVSVEACQAKLKTNIQFSTDNLPREYGFVYNTVRDSVVNAKIKPITKPITNLIEDSITGLLPDTKYFVWAYSVSQTQSVRSWTGPFEITTSTRPFNQVAIDYKMSNELFLGAKAVFDAQVDGNVTYTWHFGTEGVSTLKSPSYLFQQTNFYKVVLEAKAEGCIIKDSIVVNIVQNPFPDSSWVPVEGTGIAGFQMGCDPSKHGSFCDAENSFVHKVVLNDFVIGKTEVTQKQWRAVAKTTPSANRNCNNCPVETISWDDITVFLDSLHKKTGIRYSLPTEAQWEYAARGGKKSMGYLYAGSNTPSIVAHANFKSRTQDVQLKTGNELNLFDMSGNVSEWCKDFFSSNYYVNSPENNPQGPGFSSTMEHVIRGGDFFSPYGDTNVFLRSRDKTNNLLNTYGFRLVKNP